MRLATLDRGSGSEFALSKNMKSSWVLWADVKKEFPQDKIFQAVRDFDSFLPVSNLVLPRVDPVITRLEAQSFSPKPGEFIKPFSPKQFRDFYCFEEHVKKGRAGRGLEMIPEWYEFPVFYYSNHLQMTGPQQAIAYPQGSEAVDFELEIGCVVGKAIENATLEEASEAILGYCLLNDWTARDFQKTEMKLNMGPAKGKDFATSFGPYIITKEEIADRRSGKGYDIEFQVHWGSDLMATANWKSIHYSFEEMLVRASQNCKVLPGEVLGSGTMGGGCLMEHNIGLDKAKWLKPGDAVELSWANGPILKNKIL